jgi:hypothetical protein
LVEGGRLEGDDRGAPLRPGSAAWERDLFCHEQSLYVDVRCGSWLTIYNIAMVYSMQLSECDVLVVELHVSLYF